MAFSQSEFCIKLFVAFFLAMCGAINHEDNTTSNTLFQAGPQSDTSLIQKLDEGPARPNIPQEKPAPDNLEIAKEKQKFLIHFQNKKASANSSSCHVLKVTEKSTTKGIERDCYLMVDHFDKTDVKILNQLKIFCREKHHFKLKARLEKTRKESRQCEWMAKDSNGYKIVTEIAETTFKSEILIRICENMEILNSTNMDDSKSSSCVGISRTHLQYQNHQCCTGSVHFISEGVFQVEVVMLWLDKDGYLYFIDIFYSLSILSLFIIFASGIVSRNYRSERGNQILIHFAFSIFAQIMLHLIACFNISSVLCYVQIISFQYFTLVESCWTSIIAYLQYKRFVKVFDIEPNHLISKLCAIAYISPILPIVFSIFYYDSNPRLVNYLTFGLPEFFILLINSTLLILITKNIVFVKHEYIENKKSLSMEVKLIFFLFFVLDFSWFQIILTHLTARKIFIYLYLFTQSLQGFMLFLVFVIMNEHNRLIYKKFFVIYLGKLFRT